MSSGLSIPSSPLTSTFLYWRRGWDSTVPPHSCCLQGREEGEVGGQKEVEESSTWVGLCSPVVSDPLRQTSQSETPSLDLLFPPLTQPRPVCLVDRVLLHLTHHGPRPPSALCLLSYQRWETLERPKESRPTVLLNGYIMKTFLYLRYRHNNIFSLTVLSGIPLGSLKMEDNKDGNILREGNSHPLRELN